TRMQRLRLLARKAALLYRKAAPGLVIGKPYGVAVHGAVVRRRHIQMRIKAAGQDATARLVKRDVFDVLNGISGLNQLGLGNVKIKHIVERVSVSERLA